jgi:hypothetical protein
LTRSLELSIFPTWHIGTTDTSLTTLGRAYLGSHESDKRVNYQLGIMCILGYTQMTKVWIWLYENSDFKSKKNSWTHHNCEPGRIWRLTRNQMCKSKKIKSGTNTHKLKDIVPTTRFQKFIRGQTLMGINNIFSLPIKHRICTRPYATNIFYLLVMIHRKLRCNLV